MKGNIKHFFPGNNTSQGFFSFYNYILPQEKAKRIICLKGGPGTGKSTLIKKVGEHFNNCGFDIEYHHCSSDDSSLDALLINNINIAILDGTSPHIVDPINPGAVDEILNLGECLNEKELTNIKTEIINTNEKISNTFKKAYSYFYAARSIHNIWSNCNLKSLNNSKINKLIEDLNLNIFKKNRLSYLGSERHLFVTAFTPNGIITYIDDIYKNIDNLYVLNGGPGLKKTKILTSIYKEAITRGYFVEVFHDPLIPKRIEHVFIPELSTAILTSNEINKKNLPGIQIYLENFINHNNNSILIKEDIKNFYMLLNEGLNILKKAKILHDELEEYYNPNIDFDKLNVIEDKLIYKLKKYIK